MTLAPSPRSLPSAARPGRSARRGTALTLAACAALASLSVAARSPVYGGDGSGCAALIEKADVALQQAERTRDLAQARDALELLDRARQICPDEIEIPFLEGIAHVFRGDIDKTKAAIARAEGLARARAVELNRPVAEAANEPHVLYLRALVHRRFGNRPGDAVADLKLLRVRDPSFRPGAVVVLLHASLLDYAAQLVQNDDAEAAIRQASMAVSIVRGNARMTDLAEHRLAQVLSAAHRWAEAQPILLRLVERGPTNAHYRFDLAGVYAEQLHFDEAIEAWRETIKLLARPDEDVRLKDLLSDAPMRLGNCLVQSGRLDEGKKALEAYAAEHPGDGRGWYFIGKACVDFSPEDYDHALECFERARRLDSACEKTLRELYKLYSTVRRDDAKAKSLAEEIEKGAKAREAEFVRRRHTRLDGSNGCY